MAIKKDRICICIQEVLLARTFEDTDLLKAQKEKSNCLSCVSRKTDSSHRKLYQLFPSSER